MPSLESEPHDMKELVSVGVGRGAVEAGLGDSLKLLVPGAPRSQGSWTGDD